MYQDARRLKFGDLWPYPSPTLIKYPSVRKNPNSNKYHFKLLDYYRPKFRAQFTKFQNIFLKNHWRKENLTSVINSDKINNV